MELRQLQYFLAVADDLSFTRAAKRLHVVQSGVSATIKSLERELGAELFVRSPNGLVLTQAGQELRPRALATIDAARAAKDAVLATRGAVRGTVTVGTLPSIDVVDLPSLLAQLHARHPAVVMQLRVASSGSAGLARQLRDGDLDIAFVSFSGAGPPDLDARLIHEVPLILVVPAEHPLAKLDSVCLGDLAGLSFIDGPPGYGNRTVVDAAFAAAGVDRSVALEVADFGTATAYIRNGLGIAFLFPFLLDGIDRSGLATVHVADYELYWRLYVATSATRTPSAAAQALLALIAEKVKPAS